LPIEIVQIRLDSADLGNDGVHHQRHQQDKGDTGQHGEGDEPNTHQLSDIDAERAGRFHLSESVQCRSHGIEYGGGKKE
jgi:hypothetical protein